MWASVLALAVIAALDPVRLGSTLLVISRPRPVHNLLAYGVGCLTACIHTLVIPLMVLHGTKRFTAFAQDLAGPGASPIVRHIKLGIGVLALSVAAFMTVRSVLRRRQQARLPTPAGNTSTLVLDSNTPISALVARAREGAAEGGSTIRRLLGRAYNAWESGSLWVAFLIGFMLGGPPLDGLLFLLAIIVASGATVGSQVSAAIALVVGMLAVVEIALVGYFVTPAKTLSIVQRVHDWALAHRRKILIVISTVAGVSLVAQGLGI